MTTDNERAALLAQEIADTLDAVRESMIDAARRVYGTDRWLSRADQSLRELAGRVSRAPDGETVLLADLADRQIDEANEYRISRSRNRLADGAERLGAAREALAGLEQLSGERAAEAGALGRRWIGLGEALEQARADVADAGDGLDGAWTALSRLREADLGLGDPAAAADGARGDAAEVSRAVANARDRMAGVGARLDAATRADAAAAGNAGDSGRAARLAGEATNALEAARASMAVAAGPTSDERLRRAADGVREVVARASAIGDSPAGRLADYASMRTDRLDGRMQETEGGIWRSHAELRSSEDSLSVARRAVAELEAVPGGSAADTLRDRLDALEEANDRARQALVGADHRLFEARRNLARLGYERLRADDPGRRVAEAVGSVLRPVDDVGSLLAEAGATLDRAADADALAAPSVADAERAAQFQREAENGLEAGRESLAAAAREAGSADLRLVLAGAELRDWVARVSGSDPFARNGDASDLGDALERVLGRAEQRDGVSGSNLFDRGGDPSEFGDLLKRRLDDGRTELGGVFDHVKQGEESFRAAHRALSELEQVPGQRIAAAGAADRLQGRLGALAGAAKQAGTTLASNRFDRVGPQLDRQWARAFGAGDPGKLASVFADYAGEITRCVDDARNRLAGTRSGLDAAIQADATPGGTAAAGPDVAVEAGAGPGAAVDESARLAARIGLPPLPEPGQSTAGSAADVDRWRGLDWTTRGHGRGD